MGHAGCDRKGKCLPKLWPLPQPAEQDDFMAAQRNDQSWFSVALLLTQVLWKTQGTHGMITHIGRVGGPSASTNDFSQRSDGQLGATNTQWHLRWTQVQVRYWAGPGVSGGMKPLRDSGLGSHPQPLPKASFMHFLRFQRDWFPNQPLLLEILQEKINKIHCRARMKGFGSERHGCTAHFVLWALGCGQVVPSLRVVRGPWFKKALRYQSPPWHFCGMWKEAEGIPAWKQWTTGRAEHCCVSSTLRPWEPSFLSVSAYAIGGNKTCISATDSVLEGPSLSQAPGNCLVPYICLHWFTSRVTVVESILQSFFLKQHSVLTGQLFKPITAALASTSTRTSKATANPRHWVTLDAFKLWC